MRLPYVADPPPADSPGDQAVVDRIRQRRGQRGLSALDLTLLHSIPIADGWNTFLGAIRTRTTLSPSIRESAICRVATLNRAWFEWEHHAPLLVEADGVTPQFVTSVFSAAPGTWLPWREEEGRGEGGEGTAVPDEEHALVLAFTDSLTLGPDVALELFERVRSKLGDKQVVELTATVASYNCVSRFLVALDVGERLGDEGLERAIERGGGVQKGTKPAPREYVGGGKS